jgi:undecaprenyl-diphosphatase
MLHAFDRAVSAAAVQAFGGSSGFDWAMRQAMDIDLLRLGPVVGLLVYVWVAPKGRVEDQAEFVLRSLIGIVAAIVTARVLQVVLPMRARPHLAPDAVDFPPLGHLRPLLDWSSFPSDTATLTFAMVMAIALRSRPLGWVAAGWAVCVTCFPRLYLGYHYLSDLVAGAALGAGIMLLVQWLPPLAVAGRVAQRLAGRHPAAAVVVLVLVGYELVASFRTLQHARSALNDVVSALFG